MQQGGWTRRGRIEAESVDEASGMAFSKRNPGVLWVHNDSGDTATLYGIDVATGKRRATVTVEGVKAVDVEAMALTRDGRVILADTGDNSQQRRSVALYRFPEPTLPPGRFERTIRADVSTLTFPDGARNVEAVLSHPASGALWLISKEFTGTSGLYKVPDSAWRGAPTRLLRTGGFLITPLSGNLVRMQKSLLVTDAAISADARMVVIATYGRLLVFAAAGGVPLEKTLLTPPRSLAIPAALKQCEAVAFAPDGALWATTEGEHPPLYSVRV